jgi:hypothetical protein
MQSVNAIFLENMCYKHKLKIKYFLQYYIQRIKRSALFCVNTQPRVVITYRCIGGPKCR